MKRRLSAPLAACAINVRAAKLGELRRTVAARLRPASAVEHRWSAASVSPPAARSLTLAAEPLLGNMPASNENWYDFPQYCDLAFRDETAAETAFLVAAFRKYCSHPVR